MCREGKDMEVENELLKKIEEMIDNCLNKQETIEEKVIKKNICITIRRYAKYNI